MNAARYTEKKAKTKVRKKCVLKFKKIDYIIAGQKMWDHSKQRGNESHRTRTTTKKLTSWLTHCMELFWVVWSDNCFRLPKSIQKIGHHPFSLLTFVTSVQIVSILEKFLFTKRWVDPINDDLITTYTNNNNQCNPN